MNTAGAKMFSDYKATKRFVAYQEMMEPEDQVLFGSAIRTAFDRKITSTDDSLKDYYITEKDVDNCYNQLMKDKHAGK